MEDVVVEESYELVGEVLGVLGDENESEPALSASLGDAADGVEEVGHPADAVGGEEFVGFFDDEKGPGDGSGVRGLWVPAPYRSTG